MPFRIRRTHAERSAPSGPGQPLSWTILAVTRLILLFFALPVTHLLAPPARAQYMYLDSNGDGVNNALDHLNVGGSTTVDIWLITNRNKDGSEAACPDYPSLPLDMAMYTVVLHASGGTVTYGSYSNGVPTFTGFATQDTADLVATYYATSSDGVVPRTVPPFPGAVGVSLLC